MAVGQQIGDETQLRALIGELAPLVAAKIADRLNRLTRAFIERSPFVCVATSDPAGGLDVSPRGDPAGFRAHSRRPDAAHPGPAGQPHRRHADEPACRLAHRAAVPDSRCRRDIPRQRARDGGRRRGAPAGESAVGGRVPKLGILVSIEEAYTQCPKALIRSELWNPERHVDSSELPTSGEILKAVADPELDADEYNRARAERYARGEGLY